MVDPFNFGSCLGFAGATFDVAWAFVTAVLATAVLVAVVLDAVVLVMLFLAETEGDFTAVSFGAVFSAEPRWLAGLAEATVFFLAGFLIVDAKLDFFLVDFLAGAILLVATGLLADLAEVRPPLPDLTPTALGPATDLEAAFFLVSALPEADLVAGCLVVLVGRFLGLKGIHPVNLGGL